jgi:dolichol-phosphate mannosyltransferase
LNSDISEDLRDVGVVIPVLNEEKAIGVVIDEVINAGIPLENIIVVDGRSTDRTVEIAKSKGVKVVNQEGKGKALAIKTGLRHVTTPYVLVMDGDGTYPASAISTLYKAIRERDCDLVIGTRLMGKESQRLLFRLGNKILTFFFNALFGTSLHDVLSGMYIAKTERMRELGFEMRGFSIEAEIVAHFANLGRVCEEVIEYRPRIDPSAKKLRVKHGLRIALDMVRLTWRYNPAFLIFAIGSLLLIPGLGLGTWVLYRYYFHGVIHSIRGLAAIVMTGVGLQMLNSAIMTLYVKRIERRVLLKLYEISKKTNTSN